MHSHISDQTHTHNATMRYLTLPSSLCVDLYVISVLTHIQHRAVLQALEAALPTTVEDMTSPLAAHTNAFHQLHSVTGIVPTLNSSCIVCAYDQYGHRCSVHSYAAGIGSSAAYYSGGHDRPGGCTCQCWPTAHLCHLSVAADCGLLLGTAP